MEFKHLLDFYTDIIEKELRKLFDRGGCLQKVVYDAMEYSLLAGGKRIRPILTLATSEMLGGNLENAIPSAVAVECIHTYSLIHDDLPCMDNDDLRRGVPTCHKKFGEATALLAGDGLLTFAFEHISDFSKYKDCSPEIVLRIINEVARAAGCLGMIGGQVVDLESEGKGDVDEKTLTYMHNRKTGALIKVSVVSGAIAAGATDEQIEALVKFADNIGLAFQVQDDILDFTGDEKTLGKPIGSDKENEKTTYVTLLGVEKAKTKARELTEEAIVALDIFGDKAEFLKEMADYLMTRNK